MLKEFKKFWAEESGQGMAEYGLILALIAVVVIGALTTMGTSIKDHFNKIVSALGGTPSQ